VYAFEREGIKRAYISSADLMPRNLDHRVEVVTPVEDISLQAELASTFEALWRDNASSFELEGGGQWQRVPPKKDERPRSGQQTLMRRARRRVSLARAH
jgi:polyphosphate kinase